MEVRHCFYLYCNKILCLIVASSVQIDGVMFEKTFALNGKPSVEVSFDLILIFDLKPVMFDAPPPDKLSVDKRIADPEISKSTPKLGGLTLYFFKFSLSLTPIPAIWPIPVAIVDRRRLFLTGNAPM